MHDPWRHLNKQRLFSISFLYHHLTLEFKNHFKIIPSPNNDDKKKDFLMDNSGEKGKKVSSNFEYSSGSNKDFLSIQQIAEINKTLY